MRILVVDDDSLAGELTSAFLEDLGHASVLAENGLEAMEKLNEDPQIDAIISDLHMPLVDGMELFNDLRTQGNDLPFFLMTGGDPGPILRSCPGLTGCLAKDGDLGESLASALASLKTSKEVRRGS